MLPVLAKIVLYLCETKTAFRKLNVWVKGSIIGVVFGGLAIISTGFGVDIGHAVINTRDASVLTAGLIFGPFLGILAGLIGGIELFFAVYWGSGAYTQWACSISTILAGLIGAGLRKYMFKNKKPSTLYGLAIGLLTEVLHMMMVFFTNMSDVTKAFEVVKKSALPMIVINGISVMLPVLAVTLIGKEGKKWFYTTKQIISVLQRWLLLCVVVAFVLTSVFTAILQNKISEKNVNDLLRLNIQDVVADLWLLRSKTYWI